jgi:hypothetical protein
MKTHLLVRKVPRRSRVLLEEVLELSENDRYTLLDEGGEEFDLFKGRVSICRGNRRRQTNSVRRVNLRDVGAVEVLVAGQNMSIWK